MYKKLLFSVFSVVILTLLVSGLAAFQIKKQSSNGSLEQDANQSAYSSYSSILEETDLNDEQREDQDALALLPKDVLLYEIKKNGFNQDKSLYSVNAYISLEAEMKLKNAGYSNEELQENAGCWVVDLKKGTAYRMAFPPQDYKFNQWVGNDQIELVGDGNRTATRYNAFTGKVISVRTFNLSTDLETSNWELYENKESNFTVKFPPEMVIKEVNESYVENSTNRFTSFYNPGLNVTIYLGVKKVSEKNIQPRPFRTGVDGSSIGGKTVAFGDDSAEEDWFVNCDFPGENRCNVSLIQFHGSDDKASNNIKLSGQKEAFMEVDLTEKSNVGEVAELVHGMIRSLKIQ